MIDTSSAYNELHKHVSGFCELGSTVAGTVAYEDFGPSSGVGTLFTRYKDSVSRISCYGEDAHSIGTLTRVGLYAGELMVVRANAAGPFNRADLMAGAQVHFSPQELIADPGTQALMTYGMLVDARAFTRTT